MVQFSGSTIFIALGGCILFAYSAFSSMLDKQGWHLGTAARVGIFTLLLFGYFVILVLIFEFIRHNSHVENPLVSYRIRVDCPAQFVDLNHPLAYDTRISMKVQLRLFPFQKWITLPVSPLFSMLGIPIPFDVRKTQKDRYLDLAAVLPPSLGGAFKTAKIFSISEIDVRLTIDERCVAAPWEAILTLRTVEKMPPKFRKVRMLSFRRLRRDPEITFAEPFPGPMEVVFWSRGFAEINTARRGWGELVPYDRALTFRVWNGDDMLPDPRRVGVVHVMGSPVETGAGLRLSLRPRGAKILGESELIKTEEIAQQFRSLRLCIVQAPPVVEQQRTTSDRDVAGRMRRIGAELLQLGIPAVIVLPPVPEEVAAEAIDQLAKALVNVSGLVRPPAGFVRLVVRLAGRSNDSLPYLGKAVRKVQDIIKTKGHSDAESALEAAFDVCFYTIAALNLRVEVPKTG
jgi:hypothetical protein